MPAPLSLPAALAPLPRAGAARPAARRTRLLRVAGAWEHVAPPLLATAYLAALVAAPSWRSLLGTLAPLLASAAAIAAFGYLLNDLADLESDARAGRSNPLAARSPVTRAALVAAALLAGLLPWVRLPGRELAFGLLVVEIGALAAYSLPPARLKSRGAAGLAADALYGHVLPVAIVAATLFGGPAAAPLPSGGTWIAVAAGVALTAKGLRNILLHQIDDRAADRRAGVTTFVVRRGPLAALAAIDRFLLPLEAAAVALVTGLLAPATLAAPLSLGAFLLVTACEFSAWKFFHLPRRQLRLKFVWCLNDYHELWLPTALLAAVVARVPALWPLALLHLALFPRLPLRLARHLARAGRNLASLARDGVY
jgi:4-hydroxybenzoate polyprenyltransferase